MRLYFLMFITAVCSLFLLSVQNGRFFFAFFGRAPRRRGGETSAAGKSAEK